MLFLKDGNWKLSQDQERDAGRGVPEKVPHDKIKIDSVLDVLLCVRRL
jgi:hypothetical protein